MRMPNVCYFEIPVEEMERAQTFYKELFQWRFEKMPGSSEECDYWSIQTGTADEPGISCGGMMKKQTPTHMVTQYINVDSLDTYVEKAKKLGGTMLMPKTPVPGKGYFALFLDPEKNPFGLWQCDESAQ
jgi:predicted enzyme related to lactoylglutathione lyase